MDSDENDELMICAAYTVIAAGYLLQKKMRRKRRWWINKSRSSAQNKLLNLNAEPSGKVDNICRMSATDFEYILNKIGPHISKSDTSWRKAIPANERLAVTLRFLATGDSFKSLSCLFNISNQCISEIVHEVCAALIRELRGEVKTPKTTSEWLEVEKGFREQWNFPRCVGAIDSKHIVMQSPLKTGTEFCNYKGTFSIVLTAVVDANYCFLYTDVGCPGRISDGVFTKCTLSTKINNCQLNLPPDEPLPSKTLPIPYVFVADDAFPSERHIMRPFVGSHNKGSKERVFNYRLLQAHRVVEIAFGIMASVFRVLRKPMLLQPEKVTNVTMACVLLHNFLRKSTTSSSIYTPLGSIDAEVEGRVIEGTWHQDQQNMTSLFPCRRTIWNSEEEAENIRQQFAEYFVTNGKVSSQDSNC